MAFRRLKRRADALAAEAVRLRGERNAHLHRSLALLGERIASPAGLSLCFAAGFALGARRPRARAGDESPGSASDRTTTLKAVAGPLGAAALKLVLAALADGADDSVRSHAGPARGEPLHGAASGSSVK